MQLQMNTRLQALRKVVYGGLVWLPTHTAFTLPLHWVVAATTTPVVDSQTVVNRIYRINLSSSGLTIIHFNIQN
jgi:hypothetical protein